MLRLKSNSVTNIQKQKVQNLKFLAGGTHLLYYFHLNFFKNEIKMKLLKHAEVKTNFDTYFS